MRGLFKMHEYPAKQQILTVFHIGSLIPHQTLYVESAQQFWNDYERTLTPAQLQMWKLMLLPLLPGSRPLKWATRRGRGQPMREAC